MAVRDYATRGSLAYNKPDPSRGNASSGGGLAHSPWMRDLYGFTKQDDEFFPVLARALAANRIGGGLNAMSQINPRATGDWGANSDAAAMAIAQMQNPWQFALNQRGAVNEATGMAEGAAAGMRPAQNLAAGIGAAGDIVGAGLDAWGAYQDEKDANSLANEQVRQAEHQARQQVRESGSLIDDTRKGFASNTPGSAARRAMRGGQMGRNRIYWDGGL